jgi:hypothetical protein
MTDVIMLLLTVFLFMVLCAVAIAYLPLVAASML